MNWEQKYRRDRERRAQRIADQNKREALRPLRLAVNKALKNAGIPHAKALRSSRVRGYVSMVAPGWETESWIWTTPAYVKVTISKKVGVIGDHNDYSEQFSEMCRTAEKALEPFEYKPNILSRGEYEVYAVKN